MIYDYVIIFQFSDGYFKYRARTDDPKQSPWSLVQGAWNNHVATMQELNAVHPETPERLSDIGQVERIEIIALHTIPEARMN